MDDEELIGADEESATQISRRGLLVKGGLAAAGLTVLGSPAAAFAGTTSADATIKVAVVTTETPDRSGPSSRRASTRPRGICGAAASA